jgi:hypothetical protein
MARSLAILRGFFEKGRCRRESSAKKEPGESPGSSGGFKISESGRKFLKQERLYRRGIREEVKKCQAFERTDGPPQRKIEQFARLRILPDRAGLIPDDCGFQRIAARKRRAPEMTPLRRQV